jgi:non-ribosomal peptide synthetase component F
VAQAGRLADEQATTPFDLAAGSLFRCLLVKVGDDAHVLSLTAHHIVCDEWSIGLFARELSALYAAGGDPARAGLRPLPIQYGDYAAWQRTRLTGETLDRTVAYWREHLADAPPALTMPVAHEGAVAGATGGRARAVLSEAETAAVADFCRTHGVSPFMVMMAGYAMVLSRWSGQRDLVIGVPIAGRTDAGTDALIGFLLNTLPIRVDLTGEPTFADLLARVRRAALDGYAHSDAPLDVLVQQLDVNRDPRRTPLFQTVLNVVGDTPTAELTGLVVDTFDSPAALPSKFDLSLNVQESRRRTYLQLDYNPTRYDPSMVEAVLNQVAGLLRTVVADPTRGILDYQLGPAGQVEIPVATVVERPEPTAERAAVVDAEGGHSYAWLGGATVAIGERLEPDGHVGLVRRPTAWFVAALLHRLRTGGAYSVIDPELALAPSYLGVTSVLDVADHPAEPTAASGFALDAIRRHAWAVDRHGLTADDRFAALTHHPGHLVAAVTNAVAAGGTLVLPAETGTWLRDNAVTVAFLSPPQLRALREPLPALRYAFVAHAGDLLPHDIARLRELAPACRVVTAYRPDRGGRPLASYRVPDGWEPGTAPLRVPLGAELGADAVELRHPTGQPAAVGEVAELHAGDRRTGDLVRRWADGTLEYVGEVGANPAHDPVQAVRALRDLPDVTDAVVTEWADADGNPVLVGYLAGPDPARDSAAIRQHLIPRLPRYLLPAHLFVLDAVPRTPDGDYDLDALPEPDEDDLDGDRYVAPRTPVERRLAEIFEELLGLGRIGVHDSFFELNGFSLLATQMTSRVREAFQVELPLREVFGSPTVEGVAQLILWKQSEQSDAATLEAMLAEIEAGE